MSEMNFNSQICTTIEQSERLLVLGLKKETADMVWRYSNTVKGKDCYDPVAQPCNSPEQKSRWIELCEKADYLSHWFKPDGTPMTAEEVYEAVWGKDVPAWSLHRLIEMMPRTIRANDELFFLLVSKEDVFYDNTEGTAYSSFINRNGLYYNITLCIEWLIKEGYFNKEYLQEQADSSREE